MYTQFFQLKQSPFSIAPDPRYLFMSERHREALAHLLYGVGSGGGFVLLTGEIGAGKTTVCRCFMEQIPGNCKLAYIFNPKLTVEELLLSVCDEFGITLPPQGAGAVSVKGYVDAINAYLLASHAQGKNNVLIIDEAQNLSPEVLEQLRLLTNLETSERKLLQIILIGQPELRAMLARPELEQLAQRVIARYHLGSLSVDEVGSYVRHRLAVAGSTGASPFGASLMTIIHRLSKGVPRRVNLLCDRALLGAYVEGKAQVTRQILNKAAQEVFGGEGAPRARGVWPYAVAGLLAGVALTGAAAWQLLPAGADKGAAATSAAARTAQTSSGKLAATPAGRTATAQAAPAKMAREQPAGAANAALPGSLPAASAATGPAAASVAGVAGTVGGVTADAALRQLSALWGSALADGEGCMAAVKKNLRCLQGKGGLAELRLLDRPAALRLRGEDPITARYVLLMALDAKQATLLVGGKQQVMALSALEAVMDGAYITLWRAHRSWRDEVSAGDRGPDVDWLARRFAQMHGLKKPADNQALEGATLRLLREFQGAQGLKADGVAGPKTFIRLSQLAGVPEPRLREPVRVTAGAVNAEGASPQ
ncbi:ExeA family protein [Pseudoduganella violacea]|uniref:General secretion pathway protein A n=1 Tax=Pseudoduganella violacea TaxID=1715466 RepID=A0A7W5FUS5_9BURK|nr:ExeA family protein [Pseudoduganella violacea]MBB3119468.1 general secretion pathway protein A [Pseudoduganella violacea]